MTPVGARGRRDAGERRHAAVEGPRRRLWLWIVARVMRQVGYPLRSPSSSAVKRYVSGRGFGGLPVYRTGEPPKPVGRRGLSLRWAPNRLAVPGSGAWCPAEAPGGAPGAIMSRASSPQTSEGLVAFSFNRIARVDRERVEGRQADLPVYGHDRSGYRYGLQWAPDPPKAPLQPLMPTPPRRRAQRVT
jgi:hypothetical protein